MKDISEIIADVESTLAPYFKEIEETAYINQEKVLNAFHHVKATESDLQGSIGYGYDDFGRDHLEEIYAQAFKAEDAIVRPQIISGTHAITIALQSLLKYGDELIYITGSPYDTLLEVIGVNGNGIESLMEHGVSYKDIALKEGKIDIESVLDGVSERTKVIAIQRSKGYDQRPSIPLDEIEQVITRLKEVHPNILIFVDNCYGEFVERREPIECGADLIAGSLIKNPGGGLAKIGGYIAGRKDLIERCGYRLTAPGIGKEAGASLNALLEMYQGFFLAPHVVSQSLKGALFTSLFLEKMNMNTTPKYYEKRTDLIQTVKFKTKEQMISFCQSIQHASPINAHFSPEPSYMPGYEDDVIMAAGTFIQGSSIELSADGPIRPPYEAYVQGGLTYEHVKIAVTRAVNQLKEQGLI
ncbi:aminotransferase class I/II-fold pyridoxal phosphate-dependent enzyme [Staphylococcus aureus]|uniref:methionine gamma-lyase family protein n=1 Tax=Staphylococcus aureus TaxID=1280 RepID=UPI00203052E4|nr:aminotransferase class I/II-fold pyridoxal phosphate-dependent enzyme [Staphylococcus aureus]MCM0421863.1 aminotransferase class I/II-fold pyridoxal phosphate-dependent enzyme [Staphylococcus aureus]MCM0427121.1 aminotransferase class I/II-fold pyridoxal phosphate-dependent enzyme [Staphylococcus aureus]MCM0429715.1 aminotransferase class I/II-fold pyridoxal phosphate-dependent enzyme [Staphylococcus aureus]MCM0437429.1 aminotransferase class I/II-fold pyridoxal phosphate-dependent enzyme [S